MRTAKASATQTICVILVLGLGLTLTVTTRSSRASASAPRDKSHKVLSLEDRIAYQRAIEGVYWRHRTWRAENSRPKPALEEVIPLSQIQENVQDYLRKSKALEVYWQTPVTSEQLQTEMDRMARHTRQPDALREIYEALANDPFVIAECLARPALVQRLIRGSYASDERFHHALRESVRPQLGANPTIGRIDQKRRDHERGQRLNVARLESHKELFDEWWARASEHLDMVGAPPAHEYKLAAISPSASTCTDDTWTAMTTTSAPAGRSAHTGVWTGSEMIVWGGRDFSGPFNTGGRYTSSIDTWTATTTTGAPAARDGHTAVWTGSEMIVWGGATNSSNLFNSGGRYNPATDSWTPTNTTGAPDPRRGHTAVWTGSEMIVWGGFNGSTIVNTGARYNPVTDSWAPTSTAGAPDGVSNYTSIWTGNEMIVWGGSNNSFVIVNTGGRYNPGTDSWATTNTIGAPDPRWVHTAVWTGGEMVVWGGLSTVGPINTGGRYNPGTDTWTPTTTTGAPDGRFNFTAVWTGGEMIVWGGQGVSIIFNTGGRYNASTDSWTATGTSGTPGARFGHTAIWTGTEMIVWSGFNTPIFPVSTGGRYCAQVAPSNQSPVARCRSVTVSAGSACAANASIDDGSFDPDSGDTITLSQSPPGPYPLGATSVTLTVSDNHGASTECTATVTVVDVTAPTIVCPNSITVTANLGSSGLVVTYPPPPATDNCPGTTVACSPPSGSSFPVGMTLVACTATDASSNTANCSLTVTVLTPQDATQAIIGNVTALVNQGVLSSGVGNALVAKLQAAIQQADRGNGSAAINQLRAFINEVNALLGSGSLSTSEAQALIDAANNVIAHTS